MSRVWLVMQETLTDRWPDSVWTTEEFAKGRELELRNASRTVDVDVIALDLDTPDGTVDPMEGKSQAGWSG